MHPCNLKQVLATALLVAIAVSLMYRQVQTSLGPSGTVTTAVPQQFRPLVEHVWLLHALLMLQSTTAVLVHESTKALRVSQSVSPAVAQ